MTTAMIELIDTHAHIHEADYVAPDDALTRARENGVTEVICIGTSKQSSREALAFADANEGVYATIGIHPHETKDGWTEIRELAATAGEKLVGIGEIGLDYYYEHSSKETQIEALKEQLQVAVDYNLPVSFHVRDALDDFWPIFDSFHYSDGSNLRGVLHSFTDTQDNLNKALERGLYIGVNGISTFTKDPTQRAMFAAIPLERIVLETDAPWLTPSPFRGKINEPAFVRNIAQYYADTYRANEGVNFVDIANTTTANARALFRIKA